MNGQSADAKGESGDEESWIKLRDVQLDGEQNGESIEGRIPVMLNRCMRRITQASVECWQDSATHKHKTGSIKKDYLHSDQPKMS